MPRGADTMASYADVLQYLSSLDYPAEKDDVVREAEREGAPPDVLKALRALPPVDYANGSEVARSARIETAPEVDATQRNLQAREPHPRVANRVPGRHPTNLSPMLNAPNRDLTTRRLMYARTRRASLPGPSYDETSSERVTVSELWADAR